MSDRRLDRPWRADLHIDLHQISCYCSLRPRAECDVCIAQFGKDNVLKTIAFTVCNHNYLASVESDVPDEALAALSARYLEYVQRSSDLKHPHV